MVRYVDIVKALLSDGMSKNVIYKYYSRILGLGDYYTLPKAKDEVTENTQSPKTERLIAALERINTNKSHSIHKARAIIDADVKEAEDSGDMNAIAIARMNNLHIAQYEMCRINRPCPI